MTEAIHFLSRLAKRRNLRRFSILAVMAIFLLAVPRWPLSAQDNTAPAATAGAAPLTPAPDALGYTPGANAGTAQDLSWPVPTDPAKPTNDELIQNLAHSKIAINVVWTLLCGFLVMFMQAGFGLLETGLCRAKNAAHVMSTNFLIYPLGMLGFWICGFAFMFGGYFKAPNNIGWQPTLGQGLGLLNQEWGVTIGGKFYGLLGHTGFFLTPTVYDTAVFALFLFQMMFMDTTATVPTGAMAERWSFKSFMLYGFWVGMIGYPIYGNWVWGGGWLSQLGINCGLGHGHSDFAGSSVVHMSGGIIAWVGASLLGPRIGKFRPDGSPRAIPGHNVPFVMLGAFILAFGWFGFNAGSALAGSDLHITIIATNTMLASASGAVCATLGMWFIFGKPDPSMMCNGFLAGLVAITAPCAFVSSAGAVIIGGVAGLLVIGSVFYVERVLRVDDPVGAISVHGINGAWGALALGLMANGSYGQGWNGVHKLLKDDQLVTLINDGSAEVKARFLEMTSPAGGWVDQGVTGAFGKLYGAAYNDWGQLGAQLTGCLTNIVFIGLLAFVWFKLSSLFTTLRSRREDEIAGLDIPEMGAEAYPDYQLTDASSPRGDDVILKQ